jgi:beta-fructofuranosidase
VLLVGLDGCEVRLCGLCAFVRPRVPCVSRLPPVLKRSCLWRQPVTHDRGTHAAPPAVSPLVQDMPWPAAVTDFRSLLQNFSTNVRQYANAAQSLRSWMADHDPDYPLYHLAAPEGWNNDPNGVTYDPASGLYHRFYQWDKTYTEECNHLVQTNCSPFGYQGRNINARVWGHTVSRNLAIWEEWPGINADSAADALCVFSGNCAIDDNGTTVCIYTSCRNASCDTGTCAYSSDWVHWMKKACMTQAPSAASQVNHDTSIFRLGKKWYIMSGGCTYNGTNVPSPNVTCEGNAQIWSSPDLRSFEYEHPLTPGGPGTYWELPYLLPFTKDGVALPNSAMASAEQTVLLFGTDQAWPAPPRSNNPYWVGTFNSSAERFRPLGATTGAWPSPKVVDTAAAYSFNPHATDDKGPDGSTRRLMFGWVISEGISAASTAGAVPYWQSAHSLPRVVGVHGTSITQEPAPELAFLRTQEHHLHTNKRLVPHGSGYLPGVTGDSLEIVAVFALNRLGLNGSFGFHLRQMTLTNLSKVSLGCDVSWDTRTSALSVAGVHGWAADILPQPAVGEVHMHIFLDRSVLEVYSGGAAVTQRCFLPQDVWEQLSAPGSASRAATLDAFALGAEATLVRFESWGMKSMWGQVNPPDSSVESRRAYPFRMG